MDARCFTLAASLAALVLGCRTAGEEIAPEATRHAEARRDNLLVVILDDVGVDKIASYELSSAAPQTPNIDALAARGMRFTSAWAYPMCSPSRTALLTGQHPRRYGIGNRLTPNVDSWELRAGATVTLPQLLAAAPVPRDTSFLGKWHLSAGRLGEAPLHHPTLHGFAWSEGTLANLVAAYSEDHAQPDRSYTLWEEIRNGEVSWHTTYATSEVVDDALARASAMTEPWLMWVAVPSIHTPLHVPPPHLYSGPPPETDIELVDAMVEAMDAEIGRLFEGLGPDRLSRTDIVLLGDNGTESHGISPPFDPTHDKGSVYEGGVRVPFVIAGPSVARPGTVSDALVHVVDLLPTAAELAGIDVAGIRAPGGQRLALDGHSLVPLLSDPRAQVAETLYTEFFTPNGYGPHSFEATAVRDADFKYVRLLDGTEELYALAPGSPFEGEDLLQSPDALSPSSQAAWADLSYVLDEIQASIEP